MADITFECPDCKQSLAIDASSSGQTVQCPTCSQSVTVPEISQEANTDSWFYYVGKKPFGPCSTEQIKKLLISETITSSTIVTHEGKEEGRPISTTPELAEAIPPTVPIKIRERWFYYVGKKSFGPFSAESGVNVGTKKILNKIMPFALDRKDRIATIPNIKKNHNANYYILQNNDKKGPYTINQLRSLWNAGSITVLTLHCQEGSSGWIPLARIISKLEPHPIVRKNFIIMTASIAVVAWLCIIFFPDKILVENTNPSIGTTVPNNSVNQTEQKKLYSPSQFRDEFGGDTKSDIKGILGPPNDVSGNYWTYSGIIYNPDTEKPDDVMIEFALSPLELAEPNPWSQLEAVSFTVSGMTYNSILAK